MRWPRARIGADEGGHLHLLVQQRLLPIERADVAPPLDLFVRHPEGAEDVVVEGVLAQQPLVDGLQELPRLGALDDPVVVGGGEGDDLGDGQLAERPLVRALPLGGVVDAADPHDHALAGHQAGDGLDGADGARVGEGDRRALEVGHLELAGLGPTDQILVGGPEGQEVERVGVLDDRDEERPAAVGLLQVHRDGHVDVLVVHDARLAVGPLDEGPVHGRHVIGHGADHRVGDEVGEADLAPAGAPEVAVDHLAVDLEQLGRDVAEAGGGRHAQAALHVGHDQRAGPADRVPGVGRGGEGDGGRRRSDRGFARRGPGGDRRSRRRRRRSRRGRRRLGAAGAVVVEELLPVLADRAGIAPVLLVHLLDQPGVGAEEGRRRVALRSGVGRGVGG